jgi:glucosylceramidase
MDSVLRCLGAASEDIYHMDPTKRKALLKELFATSGNNIGVSYLRMRIGASDLNEYVYSYDDPPPRAKRTHNC